MVRAFFAFALILGVVILAVEAQVRAQDTPSVEQAKQQFDQEYGKWQDAIKELRRIQNQYNGSNPEEAPEFQKKWDEQISRCEFASISTPTSVLSPY